MIVTLRMRVAFAATTVAVTTAAVSFPLTILYFERRLNGLRTETRREVDAVFFSNIPSDFDGVSELALGLFIAVALGVLTGVLITRRPARSVAAVADAAQRITAGDFTTRSGVRKAIVRDDVAELANNFDSMASALERLERERVTTSASIAHELRNPLAVIQARLTALSDGVLTPSVAEYRRLLEHTHTLERVIEDLRTLSLWHAKHLQLSTQRIDLARLVTDLGVSFDIPTEVPNESVLRKVDEHRIRQAVINLIINARRHSNGSIVTIYLVADGQAVYLDVIDNGPGIDPSIIAAVAMPFSSYGTAAGTGLGLMVVHAVAAAHGGNLELTNIEPNGLRARFTFGANG